MEESKRKHLAVSYFNPYIQTQSSLRIVIDNGNRIVSGSDINIDKYGDSDIDSECDLRQYCHMRGAR